MAQFLLFLLLCATAVAKDCIPFEQAPDHVGEKLCVTGKVLRVAASQSGSFFLDFCEDYKHCPFTVVVFRSNLRKVGDVRVLEGKMVEVSGKIKEWQGRAEIILKNSAQLKGELSELPPIPKTYDADNHGRFSAGKFGGPRSKHPTRRRSPSTLPEEDIDAE